MSVISAAWSTEPQPWVQLFSDGTVIDGFESWDEELIYATHHANAYEENGEVKDFSLKNAL